MGFRWCTVGIGSKSFLRKPTHFGTVSYRNQGAFVLELHGMVEYMDTTGTVEKMQSLSTTYRENTHTLVM